MTNQELLINVFKILNDSGLDYCVQNKYEMMPEEIPSDIDLFYRNADEKVLDSLVSEIASKINMHIVQKTPMGYYAFVYMLTPSNPEIGFQLQLDFQLELSNRKNKHVYLPVSMLNNKRFYKIFYVPSFYDEIIYTIVRRTIKKDMSIEHVELLHNLYNKDKEEISCRLKEKLPEAIFLVVKELIESQDVSVFHKKYHILNAYVSKESKINSSIKKWISQRLFDIKIQLPKRFLNPMGLSVAFLSPDGGGKSTIIEAIQKTCAGSFHGIEYRYFRPRLLKNPGSYKPINPQGEAEDNPDPHGRQPHGFLKSAFRFFFYNIDFLLGTLFVIFPLKMKRRLVIFDRYYHDYYVDMFRYQYSLPQWFPRVFSFMVPKPDLIFILDAPAQVLYDRKHELSVKELGRQREIYKTLSNSKNAYLIDANQTLDKVIEDVTRVIIMKKTEQTSRKIKA